MPVRPIVFTSAVAICGSFAHAQIQYLTQDRSISWVTDSAGNGTIAAPDFGMFSESIDIEDPPASGAVMAYQDSALEPFSIVASGGAIAGAINGSNLDATSFFDVSFEISDPVAYSFVAEVFFRDAFDATIDFFGPGDVLLAELNGFNSQETLNGILDAGQYRIVANAIGVAAAPVNPAGDFTIEFAIAPSPSTALAMIPGLLFASRRRRV